MFKMNRKDLCRQGFGVDYDETLIVRQKRNELLILWCSHDGHQNDRETGCLSRHFEWFERRREEVLMANGEGFFIFDSG